MKRVAYGHLVAFCVSLVSLDACSRERHPPLFKQLTPGHTGVTFANSITTNDSVNVQTDPYVYNGAGVAVGDIDNDGLPDIFFAGNQVSSRLYLNKGNMRFEDITQSAGVETHGWATGVTMVDINNDGRPDIYVSNDIQPNDVLYVNNGDGTFTDQAGRLLKHTSFAGMGVDIADFNNDGLPDILQADMMPPDLRAQKRMSGHVTYGDVTELGSKGFRHDYDVNSL